MATAFLALLWLVTLTVLVPFAVLIVECLAALLPPKRRAHSSTRPTCAVIVPAHNEELGIARTLAALRPQLRSDDRLLVVADNCTDQTADIARTHGATVLERYDSVRRGKGYALDFGIQGLQSNPPDVVVIVDGDCVASAGSLDVLVREAVALNRPVQAVYLLDDPPDGGPKAQLSSFAFRFKNLIRPRGLDRLGLPCLLTGTGMAFPWRVLREHATLASGHIVEDMQLGLDLAVAGYAPALCQPALVTSELPHGEQASLTQRKRWEHGHLQTLLTQVPRLLAAALRQRRPALIGLALELSVPPLSMLMLLWLCAVVLLCVAATLGASRVPALVLGSAGFSAFLAIAATWFTFARGRLPLSSILAAPLYVLWKVPIYVGFLTNPESDWIRTERARRS